MTARRRDTRHVITLHRGTRGWWWERKAANGTIVASSHRSWWDRGAAEKNLRTVNAHPYRTAA
ncbi:hypothetical protein G4X40_20300 [Rhodococcus sp. D2-41]|uniref:hypothetical protein n=1 Tax=Speluncibacter jeojiensis TaxID=2710754 RepID=UPI0024104B7A|nr:hypothetical protein [Rhodococcus sp. D2-41]MDG3012485.1 hypothetical protein [Rhodococcus sp. D2-41]